ncbi:MAG: ribbon-helix-helix domain-containing protein [Candidatus Paceibacterota bacterium]
MRKVINISLPEDLYNEVDGEVKKGRYSTKSEFFRDLLRNRKESENKKSADGFNTKDFLKRVKEHAGTTGPSDLSAEHDKYLYEK